MAETQEERCERIYLNAVGDLRRFEAAWIRETFAVYALSDRVSSRLFLPEEKKFSGPGVRRGIPEKRMARVIGKLGGERIPQFTNPKRRPDCHTSHYSVYRISDLDILITNVGDEDACPRHADHRQERIEATEMLLSFMKHVPARDDAQLTVFYKHGKDEIDSGVPQFAKFEVLDPDGQSVWRRDILTAQRAYVESLLDVREEKVPDDEGIPRLRQHLRRRDGTA